MAEQNSLGVVEVVHSSLNLDLGLISTIVIKIDLPLIVFSKEHNLGESSEADYLSLDPVASLILYEFVYVLNLGRKWQACIYTRTFDI